MGGTRSRSAGLRAGRVAVLASFWAGAGRTFGCSLLLGVSLANVPYQAGEVPSAHFPESSYGAWWGVFSNAFPVSSEMTSCFSILAC